MRTDIPLHETPLFARLCWEKDRYPDLTPIPLGTVKTAWKRPQVPVTRLSDWDDEDDDNPWLDEDGYDLTPGRSPRWVGLP